MSDDYCATRTAEVGGDLWLVALFADRATRPQCQALGALRADLTHLVAHRSEPGIIAARAGWWQQELATLGATVGQHPATRLLGARAAADPALREALCDWSLHLGDELAGASVLDAARFRLHLWRIGRLHAALALLTDGPRDIAPLATALAEVELLASLGARIAESRPACEHGAAPPLVAPDATACGFVVERATALAAELATLALLAAGHRPTAIAAALGLRRARGLVADPARAWRAEPPRTLGSLFTAWRAAASARATAR